MVQLTPPLRHFTASSADGSEPEWAAEEVNRCVRSTKSIGYHRKLAIAE
jgi:hypothetical protein